MFLTKLYFIVFVLDVAFVAVNVCTSSERANSADVFRFANIYGDHMVLQMKPFSAMVWGFGETGQKVDVRLGSEVQTTEVVEG